MSSPLLVTNVVFKTPSNNGKPAVAMSANKYCIPGADQSGLTLILAHANGTHKEHWEPTLESLLLPKRSSSEVTTIREAWSFDWQDHGDSALLNDDALSNLSDGSSVVDWAKAIAGFVVEHLRSHRVIAIGHSAGAVAVVYSALCFPAAAAVPYLAFILIDPPMLDRKLLDVEEKRTDRMGHINALAKAVSMQRSQFDSLVEAYEQLCKRIPWKYWDDRVRRIYAEKGFRPLDISNPTGPVVTKCKKAHEVSKFHEWEPMFVAVEYFAGTCQEIPYHFIFGEVNDVVPRYVQDNVTDASEGRVAASIQRIPKSGHMVVQQQPDALANALQSIIHGIPRGQGHRL